MLVQLPMPYFVSAASKTSTSFLVHPGDREKFHKDLEAEECFMVMVEVMVVVEWGESKREGGTGEERERG